LTWVLVAAEGEGEALQGEEEGEHAGELLGVGAAVLEALGEEGGVVLVAGGDEVLEPVGESAEGWSLK
jgi:hypothetical protein